ncbi:30S ribosome-binding factor RbfA [Simiduia sp. 21SJ11W-1]|uniref:30S ribosome-binding factor RbfA n=1 Tax=Simiduia sp. 21SJ11W-1 TaxID=2909669 RepID=UPI00209DA79D|nr:30S ribosome-binding factor RbfA [Simiduia sp. 21SJ11W-1]UTA47022.1 30S ribosome-binding factor RbfA [Simiduia sp. 21SJ11W-1]
MAREFKRTDRVADALQRSVSRFIQQEIRDPRIGMVNVNDVTVTRDLAFAKIFVTFVGRETDAECEAALAILNKAAGFLRSLVAKDLDLRTTPRLQFVYDKTTIRGNQLANLIDRAVADDKAKNPEDPAE